MSNRSQLPKESPIRYYARGQKGSSKIAVPNDMYAVSLSPEEGIALAQYLPNAILTSTEASFLDLSPTQTADVDKQRESAFNAFKKILAAQPDSLLIEEFPKRIVGIPCYTKPHLIEILKIMNDVAIKGSGKSSSATSEIPKSPEWASIANWPPAVTDAVKNRKTSAIAALNELSDVIPDNLKSSYNKRNYGCFPSQQSPTILVGLIYFSNELDTIEILNRAPVEIKPYLSRKKIEPSVSNKKLVSVLVVKDPDLHMSELKSSLQNYFSQCYSVHIVKPNTI